MADGLDQVPDQPCPKCGSADTWLRYESGCEGNALCLQSSSRHRERFDRGCRRCRYQWATFDMLTERRP